MWEIREEVKDRFIFLPGIVLHLLEEPLCLTGTHLRAQTDYVWDSWVLEAPGLHPVEVWDVFLFVITFGADETSNSALTEQEPTIGWHRI